MTTAVIVDAVRTAGGKRHGKLSGWHPVDLAAETLKALVERNDLDPALIDDVIMGCVMQVGAQAVNVGRNAVLAAGFPGVGAGHHHRPAVRIVPAGPALRRPGCHGRPVRRGDGRRRRGHEPGAHGRQRSGRASGVPFGPTVARRYEPVGGLVPQGISAEMIADQWDLSREDLDRFSARSQQNAARATAEGRFEREILPVASKHKDKETGKVTESDELVTADEGIRPDTTVEALAKLKPSFKPDGKVTAGNSSQITDGASAVLIMSEERASALGLTPRARFHTFALAGVDPVTMLTGPIPATTKVLERAKLTLDDIDLVEINEAFASVVLAWEKEHHPDMDRVNVNGGAIALGHPLGLLGHQAHGHPAQRAGAHRRPLRAADHVRRRRAWPTPPSSSGSADLGPPGTATVVGELSPVCG